MPNTKTQIQLPHKVCDLTCMVNGLEDIYEWKTGQRLPDRLLFFISGMAGFTYIRQKNAPIPRMALWGTNPRSQYDFLSDLLGYRWQMIENRSFTFALQQAKNAVSQGTPVILGALDMYHLPYYPKFYHRLHIPIHYILMSGFDDQNQTALIQDCGLAGTQTLPYQELEKAWNVNVPGVSKKNTLTIFHLENTPPDTRQLVFNGLQKKAAFMLKPPAALFGIPGMRKLAKDITTWENDLTPHQLQNSLCFMAEYTGYPPGLPARLIPGLEKDFNNHAAGRLEFAALLQQLAQTYHQPAWQNAANLLQQSATRLESLTTNIVDYILKEHSDLTQAADLITEIADLEEQANQHLMS